MEHVLPDQILSRPIAVDVIGCGGTGSQIVSGLARLHHAMIASGHRHGLQVTVYDDDIVEEHNIGRQPFIPADIGQRKAEVMVFRLNVGLGLNWNAVPERYVAHSNRYPELIVGCVDTKASRKIIADKVQRSNLAYWLDLGNGSQSGQALLGLGGYAASRVPMRLPLPSELLPELICGEEDIETPTCSVQASITRQGLFLNQMVATWGLQMLFELFLKGRLRWHGAFINLATGTTTTIKVDPKAWARFGVAETSAADTMQVVAA